MFIREVKGYRTGYCLEVVRVLNCDDTHGPGIKHITAKRWGVDDDGQPVDDGHHNESYYCDRLRPVRTRAWRFLNGQAFDCRPMYWRQINIKPKRGQQELFQ